MSKFIDLTGRRFGHWTVLRQSDRPHYWITRCDCGKTKITLGRTLRYGSSTNCGCVKARNLGARSLKHGMSGTSLYSAWNNMKGRCTRPSRPDYARYGGRGIRFCEEWADFATFKEWATKHGYSEGLSLELIEGAKIYSPANCRWRRRVTAN